MRSFLISLLLVALIAPGIAAAQLFDGSSQSTFDISLTPQFPAPRSSATLTTTSSAINVANATLAVSVNGKEIYKGSVQPIAIPTGNAGSVTTVRVTLASNGTSESQALSFQAQDISLVAEPAASVPPLYLGKPSVPLEGETRIVAVANLRSAGGKAIDPATCSYAWSVDDTKINDLSGIGKSSILVDSPLQYRSRNVSVTIQSQDGGAVGGATISLSPQEPSVRIYRVDSLLGILFDHALADRFAITDAEDTFYAAPFSFPLTNGSPAVAWFLNGERAQIGRTITLRPSGAGQGSAFLSAEASANESVRAMADLPLSFGAKPSGFNLFGL